MLKNPIMGGSKGLPPLKNEKKKVIRKKLKNMPNSLKYLI
jgi:hypothetical protein